MRVGSIPLGMQGRVTNNDSTILHVRIEHDKDDTGGYFIFKWPPGADAAGPPIFDDWIETADDLRVYFEETGWNLEWLGAQGETESVA